MAHKRLMRFLILLLLFAACGDAGTATEEALDAAEADAADAGLIECAPAGSAQFARDCTLEKVASEEGLILVVRSPDGGFRRLLVTSDGRGVVAADGAEPAIVSVIGDNRIEVRMGEDRFRLPATIQ